MFTFEKFSQTARRVVVTARDEAIELGHNQIDTGHLLIGLLAERDSIAAEALVRRGITLEAARREVRQNVHRDDEGPVGDRPLRLTSHAKKVMEQSERESARLGHLHTGPEHLLLAIAHEGDAGLERMLARVGVDLASVVELVNQSMTLDALADRLDGIQRSLAETAEALAQIVRHVDGDRH